jgi:uncharacterized protein (TIGR03086 family)
VAPLAGGTGLTAGFGLLEQAIRYALAHSGLTDSEQADPELTDPELTDPELTGPGQVAMELLSRPTPCADWDLRTLLLHVSDSLDVIHEAIATGYVDSDPPPCDCTRHEPDPVSGLRRGAANMLAICAACAAAEPRDRTVAIADRHLTASIVAMTGALEIAVHGWDIREACGHSKPIPFGLATALLPIVPMLVAPGNRAGLFADPVPVPPLTSPGDRLVALLGREPRAFRGDSRPPRWSTSLDRLRPTPATALGAAGVAAYAAREGVDIATFLKQRGPALTPEQAGKSITDLVTDPARTADAYLLTADGLSPLDG